MADIDYSTIISSFDKKGTLLKWLITLEDAIKKYGITKIEKVAATGGFKLKFTFKDATTYTSDLIEMVEVDVDNLLANIEGSTYISVDENEDGDKVLIELDETNLETTIPRPNSSKLITSGAVKTALNDLDGTMLKSEGATNGQVLTANGTGGANWTGTPKIYKHIIKTSIELDANTAYIFAVDYSYTSTAYTALPDKRLQCFSWVDCSDATRNYTILGEIYNGTLNGILFNYGVFLTDICRYPEFIQDTIEQL